MATMKSSYFILGIKGAAMANLAVMLTQMGSKVTGVDVEEEFITDETLKQHSISFTTDFTDTSGVDTSDIFVYSAAHGGLKHQLAEYAKSKGKTLISQPALLGEIFARFPNAIAVSGCHGKTTTSSLLAWALSKLGVNPSFMIGAPPHEGSGGGALTQSEYMVVEADEYGVQPPTDKTPKLLFLHPSYSICTNIDFDHPDVYESIVETKNTFQQFFKQSKRVLACGDDVHIKDVIANLPDKSIATYGTGDTNSYQIRNITQNSTGSTFELWQDKKPLGTFSIRLFGDKNILNAGAVVACLFDHGFSASAIQIAIDGFTGAKRRQEQVWTDGNSYLFDDYGHHPVEIAATISSLKSRFPSKKLHVAFQPHTYSRTLTFLTGFIKSLSLADVTYLLPIFASARENSADFNVSSKHLVDKAKQGGITTISAYSNNHELLASLKEKVQKGDVVLTLGAGDIYKLKNDIITILNSLNSPQEHVDLFPHLSMRIHAFAQYFYTAKTEQDIVHAAHFAKSKALPLIMLGGGSNLVFNESEVKGVVVKNMYSSIDIVGDGKDWSDVKIASGTPMSIAVNKTVTLGLSGLEYHRGLPGTVGGGIAMNSKWTKPTVYVGDFLVSARIMDRDGNVKEVSRDYFKFAYDYSIVQDTKEIVLSAIFRMKKVSPQELEKRAAEAHVYRTQTQPMGIATCGCFFQNLTDEQQKQIASPTKSAGYLIDQCGLKGYSVGGFSISKVHANFIENDRNATARPEDLQQLVTTIKEKVKAKFGIKLIEEVKVL